MEKQTVNDEVDEEEEDLSSQKILPPSLSNLIVSYLTPTTISLAQISCLFLSNKWLLIGTTQGMLYLYKYQYVYDETSSNVDVQLELVLQQEIILENNQKISAPILMVSISTLDEQAFACVVEHATNYLVIVFELAEGKKLKIVNKHTDHHKNKVNSICFGNRKLFSGDETGLVLEISTTKSLLTNLLSFGSKTVTTKVLKEENQSSIVQLQYNSASDLLLVSTTKRSVLVNLSQQTYRGVGKKERDGQFGACFQYGPTPKQVIQAQKLPETHLTEFVYAARPMRRIWSCDKLSAQVLSTLKFPKLSGDIKFELLYPLSSSFLIVTWTREVLMILDIKKIKIADLRLDIHPIHYVTVQKYTIIVIHGEERQMAKFILQDEKLVADTKQKLEIQKQQQQELLLKQQQQEQLRLQQIQQQEQLLKQQQELLLKQQQQEQQEAQKAPVVVTTGPEATVGDMFSAEDADNKSTKTMSSSIPIPITEAISTSPQSSHLSTSMESQQSSQTTSNSSTTISKSPILKEKPHIKEERQAGALGSEWSNATEINLVESKKSKKKKKKIINLDDSTGPVSTLQEQDDFEEKNIFIDSKLVLEQEAYDLKKETKESKDTSLSASPLMSSTPLTSTSLSSSFETKLQQNEKDLKEKIEQHKQDIEQEKSKEPVKEDTAVEEHESSALATEVEKESSITLPEEKKDDPPLQDKVTKSDSVPTATPAQNISTQVNYIKIESKPVVEEKWKQVYPHVQLYLVDLLNLYEQSKDFTKAVDKTLFEEFLPQLNKFMNGWKTLNVEHGTEFVGQAVQHLPKDSLTQLQFICNCWLESKIPTTKSSAKTIVKHQNIADQKLDEQTLLDTITQFYYLMDLHKWLQYSIQHHYESCVYAIISKEEALHHCQQSTQRMDTLLELPKLPTHLLQELFTVAKQCYKETQSPWVMIKYLPKLFSLAPQHTLLQCSIMYPQIATWIVEKLLQQHAPVEKSRVWFLKYMVWIYEKQVSCYQNASFMHQLFEILCDTCVDMNEESEYYHLLKSLPSLAVDGVIRLDYSFIESKLSQYSAYQSLLFQFLNITGKSMQILKQLFEQKNIQQLEQFISIYPQDENWHCLLQLSQQYESTLLTNDNNSDTHEYGTRKHIIQLMCLHLDALKVLQILSNNIESCQGLPITIYKQIYELANYEVNRAKMNQELLQIVDAYMWSERDTVMSPQVRSLLNPLMNSFEAKQRAIFSAAMASTNSAQQQSVTRNTSRVTSQQNSMSTVTSTTTVVPNEAIGQLVQEMLTQLQYSIPYVKSVNSKETNNSITLNTEKISFPKSLEDASTHWGVELKQPLQQVQCPQCWLPLSEKMNQSSDILVFPCGHGYHKQCCSLQVCVQCCKK